eukprot:355142-Chlamydomonas_euryale.AAC.4
MRHVPLAGAAATAEHVGAAGRERVRGDSRRTRTWTGMSRRTCHYCWAGRDSLLRRAARCVDGTGLGEGCWVWGHSSPLITTLRLAAACPRCPRFSLA